MPGPFVHDIDPIITTVWGVHLWWYGLGYTLGFANAYLSIRRRRMDLGMTTRQVLDLTLLLVCGVLAGGRLVTVFHERAFYAAHPSLIPAVWLGGMATHGLIIGGFAGVAVFCAIYRKPHRPVFDALAIPTAMILAVGRIGNFIDGQIVGSLASVPWAVTFPGAEGFRHPVVLYDGLKNLALVPVLMRVRRRGAPDGRLAALFLFLYAFLRVFIDAYREYPLTLWGLPSGQAFNLLLAAAGIALLARSSLRTGETAWRPQARPPAVSDGSGLWWRRSVLAACLVFPLIIPSDATRDVPKTYGLRHPGVHYTAIYIPVENDR